MQYLCISPELVTVSFFVTRSLSSISVSFFDDCSIVVDPGGRGIQWELRLVETEILACVQTPPPPPILTSTGWYITFWLADFLMKRALHFAAN